MTQAYIKHTILIILMLALQVLVFNHIHFYGYATPLLGAYLLMVMPVTTPKQIKLILGFGIGLIQDIFANTPGMMAASLTLVAVCQDWLFSLLSGVSKEELDNEVITPSISSLGLFPFMRYIFVGVLLQNLVFYMLENFSVFNLLDTFINICGSTLLTMLIIWAFDSIRSNFYRKKAS